MLPRRKWQFLAADDPAGERIEEVHRPQRARTPVGCRSQRFAAVDAVKDDAVVAHGPAFALVHELHGMQRGIVEVTQVGPAASRGHAEKHQGRCQQ